MYLFPYSNRYRHVFINVQSFNSQIRSRRTDRLAPTHGNLHSMPSTDVLMFVFSSPPPPPPRPIFLLLFLSPVFLLLLLLSFFFFFFFFFFLPLSLSTFLLSICSQGTTKICAEKSREKNVPNLRVHSFSIVNIYNNYYSMQCNAIYQKGWHIITHNDNIVINDAPNLLKHSAEL